jgi:hypothetical protein
MESKLYHGGKPEAMHQLVQAIDEAAVGMRNEVECMQWHNNWQHACNLMVDFSNMCRNNLETELL